MTHRSRLHWATRHGDTVLFRLGIIPCDVHVTWRDRCSLGMYNAAIVRTNVYFLLRNMYIFVNLILAGRTSYLGDFLSLWIVLETWNFWFCQFIRVDTMKKQDFYISWHRFQIQREEKENLVLPLFWPFMRNIFCQNGCWPLVPLEMGIETWKFNCRLP